ncbi:hypothetical protein [Robertkochia aurantiaca]|uniref:hypothetical protein n=1 Tax=Robertkochia aurantiaca TaxID=2873700 RepID=UPI001CCDE60A|nr:hypothetical protein [Robertkochia sp. 3YJGBD-33]
MSEGISCKIPDFNSGNVPWRNMLRTDFYGIVSNHDLLRASRFYGNAVPKTVLSDEKIQPPDTYDLRLRRINAFGLSEVTDKVAMGLLKAMGYHTGRNGITGVRRRRILDRIYFNELPKEIDEELRARWRARTPKNRLRVIAETLSYICIGREFSLDPDSLMSVKEIREDLCYLKKMYYYPFYDYMWPESSPQTDGFISHSVIIRSSQDTRTDSLYSGISMLIKKILSV